MRTSDHRHPAGRPAARALAAALLVTALTSPSPAEALLFMDDNPGVEIPLPDPAPPAVPAEADLVRFEPTSVRTRNQVAIDGAHLLRVEDSGQLFTLVITSPSGARNVSLEALRCNRREFRRIAIGRDDGTWATVPGDTWRSVDGLSAPMPPYRELYELMCSGGIGIDRASTLKQRLRDSRRID